MIKVLSIAGSDPSSGAGIQADLKTFQALGVFGMAVPAALTAQNSRGVSAIRPVPAPFLVRQLEALLSDIGPQAVKTGMLMTAKNVEAVANAAGRFGINNLVIDPVLRSSSGRVLLEAAALRALTKKLFPRALVVTPNIPETEALTGMRIRTEKDLDRAAALLLDLGPPFVLIKGGHLRGMATDRLYGRELRACFSTSRQSGEFHGSGCMLSAAIAVFIARGNPVEKAVEKAKQHVDKMLRTAQRVGEGATRYFQF